MWCTDVPGSGKAKMTSERDRTLILFENMEFVKFNSGLLIFHAKNQQFSQCKNL